MTLPINRKIAGDWPAHDLDFSFCSVFYKDDIAGKPFKKPATTKGFDTLSLEI